jgi:hypothetical protein
MAKLDEHCAESIRLFGKPYEEVHRWLDELAGTPRYGMRHRRVRHHEVGIRQAVALFGTEAGPVARQHVITDLQSEGWTSHDRMPEDEDDYVQMGLF